MLTEKIQKELMGIDVAFLVDATYSLELPDSHFDHGIKSVAPSKKLIGTALTIRIEAIKDKKLANFELYSELQGTKQNVPYPVLVVELPKELHNSAIWGEGSSTLAKSNGFVGAVIEGGVRDISVLRSIEIPTFCRTIAPGYIVGRVADVGNPITVGGRIVRNGDILVGDDDGVIVIKPENLNDIITRAKRINEWEHIIHDAVKKGLNWKDAYKSAGPSPLPY